MADNSIVGFKKLMRYAQNLAEYEQGIADGIIDENVFVIVLDEKVAKFKGQTFDWSGGGGSIDTELSETSENAVSNAAITRAIVENEEVTAAALNELNERVIIHDTLLSEVCVTKNELDKSEDGLTRVILDNEVVVSASLTELDARIKIHDVLLSDVYVTKAEVLQIKDAITQDITSNEKVVAASLAELDRRVSELSSIVESIINIINAIK